MIIERFEKFSAHQIRENKKCTINKSLHCGPRLSDSACIECMNRYFQNLADAGIGDNIDG